MRRERGRPDEAGALALLITRSASQAWCRAGIHSAASRAPFWKQHRRVCDFVRLSRSAAKARRRIVGDSAVVRPCASASATMCLMSVAAVVGRVDLSVRLHGRRQRRDDVVDACRSRFPKASRLYPSPGRSLQTLSPRHVETGG